MAKKDSGIEEGDLRSPAATGHLAIFHYQVMTAKLEEETKEMAGKLQGLTENTASDGAIISVITVVSGVCLPGSFMAKWVHFPWHVAATGMDPRDAKELVDEVISNAEQTASLGNFTYSFWKHSGLMKIWTKPE
ncbi:hypothetical protein MCOR25_004092 [Pyricularia grisea]|uniref:Uncharacterized protein n=1 Tax=Pyricularia grisea TaxID=148305 RepID=A0A6P8AY82_PYRGI|nr:hypothetical protein PgNI_10902 [Pyricularia grisea]KAI6370803.1 hypothetical protein MCOR25_004092 [Pyricularia grisea]TLD07292.1 hypothetical protein PgNI_10902 [Pyricularia grisea]